MMRRSVRLSIATLFGVIVFLFKMFLPTPVDKMFIAVQALLLALGSLTIGGFGATYVALVGGFLTTVWRLAFVPFSLIFALIYGLTVDIFFRVFGVKREGRVRTGRSVIALTLSTAITGILTMSVTVMMGLMPMTLIPYLIIILAGILNGAVAGYLTPILWNKYLVHCFKK
jgi:hypothetical protein